jgi:UDP-N-acetylmuramate dehydrogenase
MSLVVLSKVNLAQYTSWWVGGDAEFFCMPKTIDDLKEALVHAKKNKLPITILGGGSNVLISDDGVPGLTICLRQFAQINSKIENNKLYIEALSGTGKNELLKVFLKNKLAPALFLAGLPGDVGGGVVMNAGVAEAFVPREFMDVVDEIQVMDFDGNVKNIDKKDLKISYRHTDGWQPGIILSVKISWPMDIDETILQKVKDANRTRLTKQPLDMPSCGSVFKNPPEQKAAQLIDQSGLKGFRIGDAQVSLKHANFVVNLENAKAKDIWEVIQHVRATVLEKQKVSLTTEVVKLGLWY